MGPHQPLPDSSIALHLTGDLTLDRFKKIVSTLHDGLRSLDTSRTESVVWRVEITPGSTILAVHGLADDQATRKHVAEQCATYVEAAQRVASGTANAFRRVDRHAYDLLALADENHTIGVGYKTYRIHASGGFSPPQHIPPPWGTSAYSTIRGRVETLSRRSGQFTLYELIDDKAVICVMAPALQETMRNLWGHIADVTGLVEHDPETDLPQRITEISDVERVTEGEPDDWRDAIGAVQDATEPAEVIIRRLRDAS